MLSTSLFFLISLFFVDALSVLSKDSARIDAPVIAVMHRSRVRNDIRVNNIIPRYRRASVGIEVVLQSGIAPFRIRIKCIMCSSSGTRSTSITRLSFGLNCGFEIVSCKQI